MGQQDTAAPTADQEQAAACLKHYFDQRVAEAMPAAFNRVLGSAPTIANWLAASCAHGVWSHIGPLDEGDVLMVGSFTPPTLLVLLMDKRQPAEILVAARDALVGHLLAAEHIKAQVKADAEGLARRAVQHLAQQQQLERAEAQSLYGREHGVTGEVPA